VRRDPAPRLRASLAKTWAWARAFHAADPARASLALILAAGVVLGLVFTIWPRLDLLLTAPFYDRTTNQFPLTFNVVITWLRDEAVVVTAACLGCVIAAVALKLIYPTRKMPMPGRAVLFLTLTFALGPGLLVNGLLKEHWSRPRPAEVTEFGGDKTFMPWWDPRGGCDQNCSFVSGETSTAAWTLAPAILIPGPLGVLAVTAALILTFAMATMRFIVGGHFFSDIGFAIVFTSLTIWVVHGLIYRWPRTAMSDITIERAIARAGLFMRYRLFQTLWRSAVAAGRGTFTAVNRLRQQSDGSRQPEMLAFDPELTGRLQDIREAYFGASEQRIISEAIDCFIAERLRTEPEVKRRYEAARRRRLGLSGPAVRLVATDKGDDDGHIGASPKAPG
jgi:lipid A 4'-phosphatase